METLELFCCKFFLKSATKNKHEHVSVSLIQVLLSNLGVVGCVMESLAETWAGPSIHTG